jgi:antitoxin PrlF
MLNSEHPLFADTDACLEIVLSDTEILRLMSLLDEGDIGNSLLMRLFLDFALIDAVKSNNLKPYTTEMAQTANKLIEGVVI